MLTRKFFFFILAVIQILASNREKVFLTQARHGPTVGAVDKLCSPSQITNGTCLIQNKDVRLTYDFVYTTALNLIFDNTQVECITTNLMPCMIYLKLNGTNSLAIQNQTIIIGKQVIIQAPKSQITIHDSSSFSVSGQSLNQNGTQVRPQDGAQFVGQGGACNVTTQNYTTFGNFDMLPDFTNLGSFMNQMGSIGYQGDAETAGGGRMIIIADSINTFGYSASFQANARPTFDEAQQSTYGLVGGSGGYIYISTLNLLNKNDLNQQFRVEAQGGHGTFGNYGGSGGVIVFDDNFGIRTQQVTAAGGNAIKSLLNTDGCGNGAAGTLFYRTDSQLVIDNEHKLTPKKTVIISSKANSTVAAKIANSILIDGGANVWIAAQSSSWISFEFLQMTENVTLGIVTSNASVPFTVSLGPQTKISPNSTIDLSQIQFAYINSTYWFSQYSIGNLIYGNQLEIYGGIVNIFGSVKLTLIATIQTIESSRLIIDTQSLILSGRSSLISTNVFVHTVAKLQIDSGYNISSYRLANCHTLDNTPIMFSCVPFKSLQSSITESNFMSVYSQSFSNTRVNDMVQTIKNLTKSFEIYLMSEQEINMSKSSIEAPRIGICAPNISTSRSNINAAERGCWSGAGNSAGASSKNCSGSGGAYGGYGGVGLSKSSVKCNFQSKPYFDPVQALYTGSSGGSAVPGGTLGGNGGGLIWLSASQNIELNQTLVSVKGQAGLASLNQSGSGGGSGGSVQIVTKNIAGDAIIDLSGGDGSIYGGGGGSGGRFVSQLLQYFNSTNFDQQSLRWNGTVNLNGGLGGPSGSMIQSNIPNDKSLYGGDGQSGTTSQTKCFGGFNGPFCKPCAIGEFKFNFGLGVCQPCTNKPVNSYYSQIAQSSAQCAYECVEGLESVAVNPNCLNSLDLQVDRVGGVRGFLLAIFLCFFLTLILWIFIIAASKCIGKAHKDRYSTVYDGVLFSDTLHNEEEIEIMLGPQTLKMKDCDIWSHTHRMYLIGENSINYPWFMPRDFPTDSLSEQGKKSLLKYIKSEQYVLDWSRFQSIAYGLMRIFLPYFAENVHKSIRRQHFKKASEKLYDAFEITDWEDITGRTVRISTDDDSRLAYVDFLDYRRNKSNYRGPQLPMTLLLAGNGTLSCPYKLNFLDDPLAKSLIYINKEQLKVKLPPFLENLNTLLDKLCFYKFNRQTMKDLNDVIEWIDCGNKTLFNSLGVSMSLYVFENSYQEIAGGEFVQRRRSMPLDLQVFESFPAMFKRLVQHVQLKLLTKRAEIKFGLVVKSTSQEQQAKVSQKIRKISESLGGKNDRIMDSNTASLSELYEDDKGKQEFVQKQKMSSLKGIDRKGTMLESQESLLSESNIEESSVMIHGTGQSSILRIIDKSKRAFDISFESTQALELKLRKDRKRCKHNFARFKSVIYSTWMMLFKLHGIPPTIRLNVLFLFYSVTLSIELVLSVIFILHIVNPVKHIWTIGFPYLFILPGLTIISPIWGVVSTLLGSANMLKTYSSMNATMIVLNYPLTLLLLWFLKDQTVYVAVLILLIFNKILISFYGSKVRQHFANPGYAKTQDKMQEILFDLIAADKSGRSYQVNKLTPSERAAMLVQSGKPHLDSDEKTSSNSLDEDDDSFGIVSTKKLKEVKVQKEKLRNENYQTIPAIIQSKFNQEESDEFIEFNPNGVEQIEEKAFLAFKPNGSKSSIVEEPEQNMSESQTRSDSVMEGEDK